MHSKRFRKLDGSIYREAVEKCFEHKWSRRDVLSFVEEYAGISREEILYEYVTGSREVRNEAAESIALYLEDLVNDILSGCVPDDISPVVVRPRPDGITGKIRNIAMLSIPHQLLNHVAVLMLKPLLDAKILPCQHASIPGRGQTYLKDQAKRYFFKSGLGIKCFQKIDVKQAYASLKYSVCIEIIRRECPKAAELLKLLKFIGGLAPGGHLIIGGYIDAWLFNFAMSYALRFVIELGNVRRGKRRPYIVRCESYMDDVGLFARSKTGIRRAVAEMNKFMVSNLGLSIKETTGTVFLLSAEEEKAIRHLKRNSTPAFDMAGYRISRTHIIIRARVFKKIRRQLLRARDELKRTGTVRLFRARRLVSYYGNIKQSDSFGLLGKYNVPEIMTVCRRVVAFHGRMEHRKKMEEYNDLYKDREHRLSFFSAA